MDKGPAGNDGQQATCGFSFSIWYNQHSMRLRAYCILMVLLIASSCKKDEQPSQPVVPTTPQVRIVSPVNNSSVGGLVTVVVEASDDKGVAKVEVYVDSQLDTTLSVAPYNYLWDTGNYSDSSRHTIFAKAYDTDNNVTGSEVVTATVFTLQPSNLQVTTATDTSVTLQWSDNSRVETGYEIEQSENGGPYRRVKQVPQNTTTTAVSDTFNVGTTYRFRVRAVKDTILSNYSNEALLALQLPAPTNISATLRPDTAATITWQDNSTFETGFEVELGAYGANFRLVKSVGADTTITSIVDTFFAGATYSFRIRAKSSFNSSDYSTIINRSFTFPSPDNLAILPVNTSEVRLNWFDNSTFENGFIVERAENSGPYVTIASVPANVTTYNNTSLDTTNGYSFRVKAVSRYNSSAYTNVQSIRYILEYSNIRTLTGHSAGVSSLDFSPNGNSVASSSSDSTLKLWQVSDGALIRTFTGHSNIVTSLRFSPDGNSIVSGSYDYTVKLWRVNDGSLIRTIVGHGTQVVFGVDYNINGNVIATAGNDGSVKLWQVSDGTLLQTILVNYPSCVSFSPDGSIVASGTGENNAVKLWQVSNGSLVRSLVGHNSTVYSLDYSPDGNTIASGSADGTIKLWRTSDGTLIRTLTDGPPWDVRSVAFSSGGDTLVSGGDDRAMKLWRVSSGTLIARFESVHVYSVTVAFSPDGTTIASSGGDGFIKLWQPRGRWQLVP